MVDILKLVGIEKAYLIHLLKFQISFKNWKFHVTLPEKHVRKTGKQKVNGLSRNIDILPTQNH